MALSANLYLRQTQSLVMTPQLMQSIQLLQMTHLELTQFIAQEVEKNPLLEMASTDDNSGDDAYSRANEAPVDNEPVEPDSGDTATPTLASDWYEDSKSETLNEGLDANFGEAYSDEASPGKADAPELIGQWKSMPGAANGEGYDLDDFVAGQTSLRDHLLQQLPFAVTNPGDRLVALALIDQLDEAGYLRAEIEDTCERFGTSAAHVEGIISTLQTMDPPGVFARSLSECLSIQLKLRDRLDPAMQSFVKNLELLAKRDFSTLKRLCGVDEEDLLDMLAEVRKLNPKPGSGFETAISEAVIPDIIVRASREGGWIVELNPDVLPKVLVNQSYLVEVSRKGGTTRGTDQAFLSDCLQNANWLTRSLDQRAKTIAKVASEIVRQQDAFLRHGVDHLRPLNLKAVADAIKMHESTVSRVTTNKYILTPRGLFELKYFFSVSIGAADSGDAHSAEAVRHRIRQLIAQESPDAVLSDDDIVVTLKRGGVDLARRTVAKYRESMNIPSSVQRRREKKAIAKVSAG